MIWIYPYMDGYALQSRCVIFHCVHYNAIILHPVCVLALPTSNALYNAGSAGLQQQDRANQDVRGVAFALDTITLLPNWPEIAKISFIFIFLLYWWTFIEALALDTTQSASQVTKIQYVLFISKMIFSIGLEIAFAKMQSVISSGLLGHFSSSVRHLAQLKCMCCI